MYILTKVNWECEIETEAYHNRTVGDALRDIQNEIKAYLNYDYAQDEYLEARQVARDFVTIAKNLKDYDSYTYGLEGDSPVSIEMRKQAGRLVVDVAIKDIYGEFACARKLDYYDSNDYVN